VEKYYRPKEQGYTPAVGYIVLNDIFLHSRKIQNLNLRFNVVGVFGDPCDCKIKLRINKTKPKF
jgi:hypothetical protein